MIFNNSMQDPPGGDEDHTLVAAAKNGDRHSLERLIRRHQTWIFNLALRMVWRRDNAEDATQEILLKIITHLTSFEGKSGFRTWAYRIAVNHLLNVKKSEMENTGVTFTDMGHSLDETMDKMLSDNLDYGVALPVIVEEARIGCMTAMLMCLDRRQRAAFILGEIFGVDDVMGAEILEVSNVNFRQLLSRARRDLYQFMNGKCRLVNTSNPCRCAKKARGFMEKGYLDPLHRQFTTHYALRIHDATPDRLADLTSATDHAHALLFRGHPMLPTEDQTRIIRELLERGGLENLE